MSNLSPGVKVLVCCLMLLLVVACGRKGHRKHFWEFWKPKAPETGSIYPVSPEVEPPPPITESETAMEGEVEPLPIEGEETVAPEMESEEAMGIPEPEPIRQEATIEVVELPMINFDFDRASIRSHEIPELDQAVEWLKAHPDVQVQIEGHCDERGTREYNLNLGQRRANSVKEYLVSKGIDPNRLHTISYGEERPLAMNHDEEAWRQNRRVQFLVY